MGAVLYLTTDTIVHPSFLISLVCIFYRAFGVAGEGPSLKSGVKDQKTLAPNNILSLGINFQWIVLRS